MNANTLTGAQAKEARDHIGISLLSVSKITGINRNDLTKFEQEKAVLSAEQKQQLVDCYSSRGYQFASSENALEEHQALKSEQLDDIKQQFGTALATTLEIILQDSEDKIEWLKGLLEDYQQAAEQQAAPTASKAFTELESALIQHFEADKAGEITVNTSFFGGEDMEQRSGRLIGLFALQGLRQFAEAHPNVITTSQTECVENSDNERLLVALAECLDFGALSEFENVTSDTVK